MIRPNFLRHLLTATLLWAVASLGFVAIVDPYGVSPLTVRVNGFNTIKIKRKDIDRIIKPYEVWRYQPKTIFLGTSRIHQSIDPSALDQTRFAPAYNASIPASSLGMNISHLEQYISFDKNLRIVFVELFAYNFFGQGQDHHPKSFEEFLTQTAGLFVGTDALWDSLSTAYYNIRGGGPVYEIKPGGYFYYPPGHNAAGPFSGYPQGIWDMYKKGGKKIALFRPALDTVAEIKKIAHDNNIELIFLATPDHVYFDYYINYIGAWDVLEEWLTAVSADGSVYGFSQPNALTHEEVRNGMVYWNDPFHFSLEMGMAMQAAVRGQPLPGTPENFMVRITPDRVPDLIRARKDAVSKWAADHPDFVARVDEEFHRMMEGK